MSVLADAYRVLLREPWLAFSRWLTVRSLERRLRVAPAPLAYVPEGAGLLYVAASALPYHTSGYTIRTHEIIRALILAGGRVHSLTRSGYPGDRLDRSCDARSNETKVGEVCYLHVAKPANNRPVILYGLQAAPVIAAVAARHRVAVIHAASNHVNALPALLAARQLGIPFQYEMRGLWELTRVSRQPDFDGSQTYKQGLQLENLVARHADRLFVISGQLGRYVAEHWGIPAERIALLPNCVDPDRFAVAAPGEVEACSIGYAGSLIGYEGLDTLIEALARLKESGVAVRVRIVGDGEARSSLESLVRRLEVEDCVQFMGRQTPDVAREVIRRCAVVCLPRKPYEVCRVVPPIKLVEALAMGKSVIVPDLPVFREELGENPAGWFFRAGDSADLAKVLGAALGNLDILRALGARAREYAVSQRCWSKFVGNMLPVVQGGRGRGGTEP